MLTKYLTVTLVGVAAYMATRYFVYKKKEELKLKIKIIESIQDQIKVIMGELNEYDKDKKWIVETLTFLTQDMNAVKKDVVELKIQINTVVTRMGVILGILMVLGWLSPFILDKKNNSKVEYKIESPKSTSDLVKSNIYKK